MNDLHMKRKGSPRKRPLIRYREDRGWIADFYWPPGMGELSGKRFTSSLRTHDRLVAESVRDRLLRPLMSQSSLRGLIYRIVSELSNADKEIADLLHEVSVELGVKPEGSKRKQDSVTLRELGDKYCEWVRSSSDLDAASIRKYRNSIDAACMIIGESKKADLISDKDISKLRDVLLTLPRSWLMKKQIVPAVDGEKKVSLTTISRHLQNVRAVFKWGIDEGVLIRKDIPGERVRVKQSGTKGATKAKPDQDQIDDLCSLPVPGSFDPLTWNSMPLISRYTGLRMGEIAALCAEDIEEVDGVLCIRVDGDHVKTANSRRLVPVSDNLKPVIDQCLQLGRTGRLFLPQDYAASDGVLKIGHGFNRIWNKKAKKIGPFSFHCFRLYANDEMIRAGIDPMDRKNILGHTSNETQFVYASKDLSRFKHAVDQIR